MYDELVKQCRYCVEALCGECKYKHLLKPGNIVMCTNALITEVADAIEELMAERKTGTWTLKTFDDGYGEYQLYECDQCGALTVRRRNYCYNCGARMVSNG